MQNVISASCRARQVISATQSNLPVWDWKASVVCSCSAALATAGPHKTTEAEPFHLVLQRDRARVRNHNSVLWPERGALIWAPVVHLLVSASVCPLGNNLRSTKEGNPWKSLFLLCCPLTSVPVCGLVMGVCVRVHAAGGCELSCCQRSRGEG